MALTAPVVTTQVTTFDCAPSVAAGDLVYLSASEGRLLRAVDNNSPEPVMGFVIRKLSSVTCEIILMGVIKYPDQLDLGVVYVGKDGRLTTIPIGQGDGYNQIIGISFGSGNVSFRPELMRIYSGSAYFNSYS